ncbi:MAG: hypothetical protein IPP66_04565 [Anaerolineales bacterium]|nr:hypothetical protein [Anaerolineales bacterium]
MKARIAVCVLLITVLLDGCNMGETFKAKEVRPGIYMSNNTADFPFPTSGYMVYIVGETHGNREAKGVFDVFLHNLYKKAKLRDIILEEDQAYETEANAYIHGLSDTLPDGLCLRTDILGQIREFNVDLPTDKKVTVHLVDVDSSFPVVYKHLVELHLQLGPAGESIQIPELSEIQYASSKKLYALVDELRALSAEKPDTLNGLDTVKLSLEWYYLGNDMETGTGSKRNFAPIREDIITKNIKYVLSQTNDKPILAFFGAAHGMKTQGDPNPPTKDFKTWAQRLVEDDVSVYSTIIDGVSGDGYWRGEAFSYQGWMDGFQFKNGTHLASLFNTDPDSGIAYIDAHTDENAEIRLLPIDVPFGQLYDGMIIFKEFTPMENACHQ